MAINLDGDLNLLQFLNDLYARRADLGIAPATEHIAGVVRYATDDEAVAGARRDRVITPQQLASSRRDTAFIPTADETTRGIVRLATQAEVNAFGITDAVITPGTMPDATETQKGLVRRATNDEALVGTNTDKYITPDQARRYATPEATTTVKGKVRRATNDEAAARSNTEAYVTPAQLPAGGNEATVIKGALICSYLFTTSGEVSNGDVPDLTLTISDSSFSVDQDNAAIVVAPRVLSDARQFGFVIESGESSVYSRNFVNHPIGESGPSIFIKAGGPSLLIQDFAESKWELSVFDGGQIAANSFINIYKLGLY